MLSDKPKLVFTDIAGKVTLESTLPVQQIKAQYQHVPNESLGTIVRVFKENRTSTQSEKFNNALLQCGGSLL